MNYTLLEDKLQYKFKNRNLLINALTHRSYSRDNYERLEFLGDSLLDYMVSHELYLLYPNISEGQLSKVRATLVNQSSLVEIAHDLDLGGYLFLGDGEIKTNGRERPSILADVVEAIFAAISLDSDIYHAQTTIKVLYKNYFKNALSSLTKDSKSILQEYLQAQKIEVPVYTVVASTGPLHDALFTIQGVIASLNIKVVATGKTKKEASQNAALKIIEQLGIK